MTRANVMKTALIAMAIGVFCATALVAQKASPADQEFVGKVSQGGLYEVEAGKVAAMHGITPAVKDFGSLESQDHEGVNARLKKIAVATGVTITPGLNAEFAARLAKLKAVPAVQFDAFYVEDMKQIHNKDYGLFVKQGDEGTQPYKDFARLTAVLVKAHLGWLNTL